MSNKNDVYFSASEINKFTYCNYLWYYEKKKYVVTYDKKVKNSQTKKNFKRGLRFHKNYYNRKRKIRIIKNILITLIIIVIVGVMTYLGMI